MTTSAYRDRMKDRIAARLAAMPATPAEQLICTSCGVTIRAGELCPACAAIKQRMETPPTPVTVGRPAAPRPAPRPVTPPAPAAPAQPVRTLSLTALLACDSRPDMRAGHERALRALVAGCDDIALMDDVPAAPAPAQRVTRGVDVRDRNALPRTKNAMAWPPERVRALRTAMGLTVAAFARAAGVSQQSVYNWEAGQSAPQPRYWDRLTDLETEARGQEA